ncbi:histidine kinase [Rhodocytophaga aerolata]|uniref:Histidine kinase n=1 Tax=Rhodocytophaga aerolata TaxID=455078 RepID=A0ABT8RCK0_9BACT|nr:histidine kinase [Rhodocytophaga aerolata]MDO1449734.1 histidine kinase [Rhodocytophaga aerolata]
MKQHWFFTYKIYHIPFWIAYHLLWMMIHTGDLHEAMAYLFKGEPPIKFIGYIIFQAAGAYFNLYYLIPKFLYRGKYTTYTSLLLLTILACSALIACGYYLAAYLSERTFFELFNRRPDQFLSLLLTIALPSTAASMTLAMSVKLAKNWLSTEKKRMLLEKAHLETELKYLKSQINPHFLFNTINSIFVLIHKNPDLASESLAMFSAMLRYQLYECNEQQVPLCKELDFLENFIELETLRLHEGQTELAFEITRAFKEEITIAPFMLLPFVENAFKHVSKGTMQQNFIKLCLNIKPDKTLEMCIENSKNPAGSVPASGIGLQNVHRRLNLIYPDKYCLHTQSGTDIFKVNLTIDLT